ncbi:hypothetical protein L2Y96_02665 [Luteibacter aegosomaticola]|uniref:hypothetical protein n=1 Tax=Luteibacter aegosomaticola TaxID=2911538 RepID=UPI001FF7E912|nr:hypothetical protein [Luteibacter aegosomaticola]UPG90694.1 hypothetical protein L2Y96_02665 [Luteibacter aegosomaticola]
MLRAFALPVLVSLTCLLIQSMASRSGKMPTGDHPAFRFSKVLGICLSISLLVLAQAKVLIMWPHVHMELADWIFSIGISIVGVGTYVYTDRYVLTFWDDRLTYGTLKMTSLFYKDIVSADMTDVGRGNRMLVIKTTTGKVSISGYLSHIDDAASLLKTKIRRL